MTSTFQSKDLVVSTSDGNITIDCGVEIGPVSANRKCAVIRLHVGNSDNEVPGVELHNMTHPSFTISELNLNHDLYRCRISWDATTGCTEFPTFDGPISYNLFCKYTLKYTQHTLLSFLSHSSCSLVLP